MENIFLNYDIDEVEIYFNSITEDLSRKRQDLRALVGERYRDLVESAEFVLEMNQDIKKVNSNIRKIENLKLKKFSKISNEEEERDEKNEKNNKIKEKNIEDIFDLINEGKFIECKYILKNNKNKMMKSYFHKILKLKMSTLNIDILKQVINAWMGDENDDQVQEMVLNAQLDELKKNINEIELIKFENLYLNLLQIHKELFSSSSSIINVKLKDELNEMIRIKINKIESNEVLYNMIGGLWNDIIIERSTTVFKNNLRSLLKDLEYIKLYSWSDYDLLNDFNDDDEEESSSSNKKNFEKNLKTLVDIWTFISSLKSLWKILLNELEQTIVELNHVHKRNSIIIDILLYSFKDWRSNIFDISNSNPFELFEQNYLRILRNHSKNDLNDWLLPIFNSIKLILHNHNNNDKSIPIMISRGLLNYLYDIIKELQKMECLYMDESLINDVSNRILRNILNTYDEFINQGDINNIQCFFDLKFMILVFSLKDSNQLQYNKLLKILNIDDHYSKLIVEKVELYHNETFYLWGYIFITNKKLPKKILIEKKNYFKKNSNKTSFLKY